jgi:uncharacterized membrane protein
VTMEVKDTILTREELWKLADVIAEEEEKSSGEIRVTLHKSRTWREKKKDIQELAIREFERLHMHKTQSRNGVLLYLIVSDREFQILADEGINRLAGEEAWKRIAGEMGNYFHKGEFFEGLTKAVREVGAILASHFPPRARNVNELPNEIVAR